jgi:hypothetical protein
VRLPLVASLERRRTGYITSSSDPSAKSPSEAEEARLRKSRASSTPGEAAVGAAAAAAADSSTPPRCWLSPSNPDGTPGDPGAATSDFVELSLAPFSQAGSQGQTAHVATQELTQPGTVVLSCRAYGNPAGAFTAYATIAAVNVGRITTEVETATS